MLTKLNRRHFLKTTAALAVLPAAASLAAPNFAELAAKVSDVQLLPPEYGKTTIWGYAGGTPGPEVRVAQGARVQRTLSNGLPQDTSIHWHGIRIDNAMDGVSGLTQAAIKPGDIFNYDFVAPDAGTYWYHAHNNSTEQVARGLYGPLIVEEPDQQDVDREEVLILDDWRIDPDTFQIDSDFNAAHDFSHAGRLGNASNARSFSLRLEGLEGWAVALDGMPLVTPRKIEGVFDLGPAQRIDLFVDVIATLGETAHIIQTARDQSFSQVAFEVTAGGTETQRDAPQPLPANSHTMVNLTQARHLSLKMEGGAMGGLRSATLGGVQKSMGEIVEAGKFWAFNGAADGMDGPPLAELSRGEHVRLTLVNDTSFAHAMHLHGMHFHEIGADGSLGPLRDTTMVNRGTQSEIAFVADNPGQWLLHCHMLAHSASGMATKIVVS